MSNSSTKDKFSKRSSFFHFQERGGGGGGVEVSSRSINMMHIVISLHVNN